MAPPRAWRVALGVGEDTTCVHVCFRFRAQAALERHAGALAALVCERRVGPYGYWLQTAGVSMCPRISSTTGSGHSHFEVQFTSAYILGPSFFQFSRQSHLN